MELGQVVDFCITYNKMHKVRMDKEGKPAEGRRKATQSDWDTFFG